MRKLVKISAFVIFAASSIGSVSPAFAGGPATTTFTVTATVANLCTISATNMAFGTYTPSSAATATSTITSTCSSGDTDAISLSAGSGSYSQRTMINGSNSLNYNLYTDSGYMNIWDSSTNVVTLTGTGGQQTTTVYGQVPAGQYVAAGSYSDTITASITY